MASLLFHYATAALDTLAPIIQDEKIAVAPRSPERPPGPWNVLHPAPSSPRSSSSGPTLPLGPGLRRDHTKDFKELRGLYNEQHQKRAGERLPWLTSIVEKGDPNELSRFVEVVRARAGTNPPGKGCAWCNTRIATKPSSSEQAQGYKVAKECEICEKWHCSACCSSFINLGPGENAQPSRGGRRRSSRPVGIDCCDPCRRLFDVRLWRMDVPPQGLPESSAKLFEMHKDIAVGLASFSSGLAQLEGLLLTLIAEIDASPHTDAEYLRLECQQALSASQGSVTSAKNRVEIALRSVETVELCAPTRNIKLKEMVIRYGRNSLRELECRLWAAEMRMESNGLQGAAPHQSRAPPQRRNSLEGQAIASC